MLLLKTFITVRVHLILLTMTCILLRIIILFRPREKPIVCAVCKLLSKYSPFDCMLRGL